MGIGSARLQPAGTPGGRGEDKWNDVEEEAEWGMMARHNATGTHAALNDTSMTTTADSG